jgi:hypothetical protein
VGGPVGLYDILEIPDVAWTARLASSARTLYAVVRPVEADNIPADPPGQPGLNSSRVFLKEKRDYDVVLIVEDSVLPPHGWRFSVRDGAVIDVIIERPSTSPEEEQAASTGPHTSSGPLANRLSFLVPSPAGLANAFLRLPPEDLWLAPTAVPRERPRPVTSRRPSVAPDGRTSDQLIDTVIEVLLTTSEPELARRFAGLEARDGTCRPNPPQ